MTTEPHNTVFQWCIADEWSVVESEASGPRPLHVCLNLVLKGASLCVSTRKPFNAVVEGLSVSDSGEHDTALEHLRVVGRTQTVFQSKSHLGMMCLGYPHTLPHTGEWLMCRIHRERYVNYARGSAG